MVFDSHSDPLYQQAMQALQEGRWQEAIQSLEELLARYPDNEFIKQSLDEALLKQELESSSGRSIHPRRWPAWVRRYLLGIAIILFLAGAIALGILFINQRILPVMAEAQKEYQAKALLEEGWIYLARGELDRADEAFHRAGALNPGAPEVLDALSAIQRQRQAERLYQEGVRLQEEGKYQEALEYFMKYITKTPYHRDAPQRILEVHRQLELIDMFQEAKKVFEKGNYVQAVELFENLRASHRWYKRQEVARYLYESYMNLGYAALKNALDSIPNTETALDYFRKALRELPRDPYATRQVTLAEYYLNAVQAKAQGQWLAVQRYLELIYHQDPTYLDGNILQQLYEASVNAGDVMREQGDLPMAYHYYLKACQLPITNRTLCQARLNEIIPQITPTPTPTPLPLPLLKGKIVFYSQHPEQPGLWVMDPDGSNRRFYSNSPLVKQQFESMFDQYRISPDGHYRAYVTQGPNDKTPQIYIQGEVNQYGIAPTWKVTKGFTKVCYDPMWSPDGAKLVFVSEEDGSDDVWVINIDGSNPVNLTPNIWEWDKHPSWSPDGRQIVFWSNRTGIRNIYIMDSDGRNVRNISNTAWDEWRPLWIR